MTNQLRVRRSSRLRWLVKLHGVLGAAETGRAMVSRKLARRPVDDAYFTARDRPFDRRFGVRTVGHRPVDEMDVSESERATMVEYRPSSAFDTAATIDELPLDPATRHFVDLGCGLGRMLFTARAMGFRGVTGVELSPSLAADAEANAKRVRGAGAEIRVVNTDAGSFEFPTDPLLVYLFNPFGPPILRQVAESLETSLASTPRPCHVLYTNAVHAEVLSGRPAWRPLERTDDYWIAYEVAPA